MFVGSCNEICFVIMMFYITFAIRVTEKCQNGYFELLNGFCQPYLTCKTMKYVKIKDELNTTGFVKRLYYGQVFNINIIYSRPRHQSVADDFLHGIKMLHAFQESGLVAKIVGFCMELNNLQLVTIYYQHGSADKLDQIFWNLQLSVNDEVKVRTQLALDYVSILSYFHSSPLGVRVMCDSSELTKTMQQYVLTENMHLVAVDLDALPEMKNSSKVKCGHRQLFGDFVAPEQLWPYKYGPYENTEMPGYTDKTDVWKVPNVVDFILGKSSEVLWLKTKLFKLLSSCKNLEPSLRPNVFEIKNEMEKIVKDSVKNEL